MKAVRKDDGYSAVGREKKTMEQRDFFGEAKWIGAKDRTADTFSVVRGKFIAEKGKKATFYALGLGFFQAYINGVCVNLDTFLPLSSEYEKSAEPKGESFSGRRVYVPEFDITDYVHDGENTVAIVYGGGWYTHWERRFGLPKVIYRIVAETSEGEKQAFSDEECTAGKSVVQSYYFLQFEKRNYEEAAEAYGEGFDDSAWEKAVCVEALDTEYCRTDCPADALISILTPVKVKEEGNRAIYDCGENTVGYPVIRVTAKKGETVKVRCAEELAANGDLDEEHFHWQEFYVTSDGKERVLQPQFTWFAFRYFEVEGSAEPTCVKVVHANVPVTSEFECDNATLNWIYDTFVHTMLCNMHTGHPSDCPHLERRGYTGDGQLTCNAALHIFGARKFYEKWLQDIADSQDEKSGHIQYTAPYLLSAGGPGGWGCAIVEVPYRLYKHYGDKAVLEKYYGNMRRYIDYLDAHSEFSLVTSDQEGVACLGDWCTPNILYPEKDITFCDQQSIIPAPYVNTYFAVKSLQKLCEIARAIGKEEDVAEYEEKIALRKKAIKAAYFNTLDGNYFMNMHGANAFAVDLDLDKECTPEKNAYRNMLNYYKKVGHYDTGIFATDILTRVLFERGDGELALDLLTTDGDQGYEHWRKNGATTFHEYWDSSRSRSHNHPMFGAAAAYFFEYLLGIKQAENGAGYTEIAVEPGYVHRFKKMRGSMQIPAGKVSVAYENADGRVAFSIGVPAGVKATFRFAGECRELTAGENVFTVVAEK